MWYGDWAQMNSNTMMEGGGGGGRKAGSDGDIQGDNSLHGTFDCTNLPIPQT